MEEEKNRLSPEVQLMQHQGKINLLKAGMFLPWDGRKWVTAIKALPTVERQELKITDDELESLLKNRAKNQRVNRNFKGRS